VEVRRERDEARRAWDAASDPINQLLLDELQARRTLGAANIRRIQQLLGVSEQLRAERDDARKIAYRLGWDCSNFEEKK